MSRDLAHLRKPEREKPKLGRMLAVLPLDVHNSIGFSDLHVGSLCAPKNTKVTDLADLLTEIMYRGAK
jgi:hypothetical protein